MRSLVIFALLGGGAPAERLRPRPGDYADSIRRFLDTDRRTDGPAEKRRPQTDADAGRHVRNSRRQRLEIDGRNEGQQSHADAGAILGRLAQRSRATCRSRVPNPAKLRTRQAAAGEPGRPSKRRDPIKWNTARPCIGRAAQQAAGRYPPEGLGSIEIASSPGRWPPMPMPARLWTRRRNSAVPVLFGPGEPLLALGLLASGPGAVSRESTHRRRAGEGAGATVRRQDAACGTPRSGPAAHSGNVQFRQDIATRSHSRRGNAPANSPGLTPLMFIVQPPGKVVSTNGEIDEFSGEIFWALFEEAAIVSRRRHDSRVGNELTRLGVQFPHVRSSDTHPVSPPRCGSVPQQNRHCFGRAAIHLSRIRRAMRAAGFGASKTRNRALATASLISASTRINCSKDITEWCWRTLS